MIAAEFQLSRVKTGEAKILPAVILALSFCSLASAASEMSDAMKHTFSSATVCKDDEGIPYGGWWSYFQMNSCESEHALLAKQAFMFQKTDPLAGVTFTERPNNDYVMLFVNFNGKCCKAKVDLPHTRKKQFQQEYACCFDGPCPSSVGNC